MSRSDSGRLGVRLMVQCSSDWAGATSHEKRERAPGLDRAGVGADLSEALRNLLILAHNLAPLLPGVQRLQRPASTARERGALGHDAAHQGRIPGLK